MNTVTCKLYQLLAVIIAIGLSACSVTPADSVFSDVQQTTEPLLVVIDDPRNERRKLGAAGPGYTFQSSYDNDPALARAAKAVAEDHAVEVVTEWPLKSLNAHCLVIEKPSAQIIKSLEQDERVRWVQPLNSFQLNIDPVDFVHSSNKDDSIANQFVSEFEERGRNVRIGVIDTAVDSSHPALQGSRLMTADFVGKRGVPDSEPHGTAVVGLLAAQPNPSNPGVVGIAPESKIHAYRGCWQEPDGPGMCNTLTLSLALDAAIEDGLDILNLSVSGPKDRVLNELTKKLVAKGTLIVAAYDENRPVDRRFPEPQPGVIYAFGVEDAPELPDVSNVLFAPRNAISLTPMAGYDLVSGHSIATPQLSAMAACLIERYPNAGRKEILQRLRHWLTQSYSAIT
ncbi:MAG: S8 family serine peptidase [Pseudomonadota bacterium]